MPTGYTAKVEEGQSFNEYAWTCARAFGALIEMRESPLDAPIPDAFEPSTYAKDALEKARAELERWRRMTLRDARKAEAAAFAETAKAIDEGNARTRAVLARYDAMAAECRAWVPPTPEHEELRRFMLSQLAEGARFLSEQPLPERVSPAVWRAQGLAKAARDVDYYEKDWAEEQERTRKRNEWINDLRRSIPTPRASPRPTRRTKKGAGK